MPRPAAGTLGNPAFRRLMASTLVSYAGRFLDMTLLSWLVAQRTTDPLPVALLTFFRFVPFLAAGPSAGFVADRFPRLRLMRLAQVGLALAAAGVAALLFLDAVEIWHAYLYAFVNGCLLALDSTARRSYMAGVVGSAWVTAAVSIDMVGMTLTRIAFAGAGGLVLAGGRSSWAFVALAALAVGSAALTRGLPPLFGGSPRNRESFVAAVRGGVQFARQNRLVLGGLVLVALANLTGFAYEPVVPAVADDVFHAGPLLFGVFLSATGVGSLVSSLWLSLRGTRLARPGLTALVAAAGLHVLQVAFSYADTVVASAGSAVVAA